MAQRTGKVGSVSHQASEPGLATRTSEAVQSLIDNAATAATAARPTGGSPTATSERKLATV
ncbi:MAG: hypothetical protein CMM93_00335 [Rickettsiales bacterium]|nr:hypothetical protein [Rickettsiales bacterium]